jgi:hypothetical protein
MIPAMPAPVATAFAGFPPDVRDQLRGLRGLIFRVAGDTGAAPLTETLKWGQPAYLTEATRSGTTVRLGLSAGGEPALLVHCQTTLVAGYRDSFGTAFRYEGTRALIPGPDLDADALAICIARALTYHRTRANPA